MIEESYPPVNICHTIIKKKAKLFENLKSSMENTMISLIWPFLNIFPISEL